ncbi:MAG: CvpA family protein [Desulfovibrionaceae bacterium]
MNALDIVIILVVLLAMTRGLFKGLVREVLSLGSLVLGIFLAAKFHSSLSPYLEPYCSSPSTATAASFLILFIGTLALAWFLGHLFKRFAEDSLAGWIDTVLGGALGFCEGTLACLVLVLMLGTFLPHFSFYADSLLAPRLLPAAALIGGFLPEPLTDAVNESGNTLPAPPPEETPGEKGTLQ